MFFRNLFEKFFQLMHLPRPLAITGERIEHEYMAKAPSFWQVYRDLRLCQGFVFLKPYIALALIAAFASGSLMVAAMAFSALAAFTALDALQLRERWANCRFEALSSYRAYPVQPVQLLLMPGPWLKLLVLCVIVSRAAFELGSAARTVQAPEPRPTSYFICFIATDLDIEQEVAADLMSREFIDEMGDRGIAGPSQTALALMIASDQEVFDEAFIRHLADYTQSDHAYFGFVNRMYTLEGEVFAVDIYRYDRRSGETIHASYDCGGSLRAGQACMDLAADYFSGL